MKLSKYTRDNMQLRHSLVRLSGVTHLSIKTINDYLKDEVSLRKSDSLPIMQADKCIKFIEGVKQYRMDINSEDFIITLVTLYPYNMMEESFLRSEFPKEMAELRKILQSNVKLEVPIFTAAKNVLDFIMFSRLVKANTLAVMFLITNLMVIHSNNIIVLEDSDEVDPGLLMEMQMIVDQYA